MRSGIYFLNNSGSRWVVYENDKKEKIKLHTYSGNIITRTVIFYESFGNFAAACISYKGKKIKIFLDQILPD